MREQFGDYEIIGRIGTGGMAEVLLARQKGNGGYTKICAIKRVLQHFAGDDAFTKMFIDEAVLAAKLNHSNIVQVFAFGVTEGTFFLAMEYVEGVDLRRLLREGEKQGIALPPHFAVEIALGMCRGLGYAHTRTEEGKPLGIVHRDVSPHNVLVALNGGVKIMDFGIAKATVRATKTETGVIKGKMAYMSPEQIRGEEIDPRTDIFATGICLWEMLTGRRLYVADSDFQLQRMVSEAKCPEVAEIVPGTHPELNAIVKRFLAPRLEDRFQTMREAEFTLAPVLVKLLKDADEGRERLGDFLHRALLPKTIEAIKNAGQREETRSYPAVTSATAPLTDNYTRERGTVHSDRAATMPTKLPQGPDGAAARPETPAQVVTQKTAPKARAKWWLAAAVMAAVALIGLGWGLAWRQASLRADRERASSLAAGKEPVTPVAAPVSSVTPAASMPASATVVIPAVIPAAQAPSTSPASATGRPSGSPSSGRPRVKNENRAAKVPTGLEEFDSAIDMPTSFIEAAARQGQVRFLCPVGSVVTEPGRRLGVVVAERPMRVLSGTHRVTITMPDQKQVMRTFKLPVNGQLVVKCE